jgi:hypothetical protein
MMKSHKNFRQVLLVFLMICSMPMHGQMNLTTSATATADTSHVDYPAVGAIDRDTTDGAGWGVSAIDTVYESEINIAPNAIASADDSSGPPSDAIDGDTTDWTGWSVSASFDVDPHWLELTWESAQSVSRVVLFTNSSGDGAYALRGYTIQYWDGVAYQDIDTVSGNIAARITSAFPSVTTTKIRIYCQEPDSESLWYRINELEVYTDVKMSPHWLDLNWAAPVSVNRIVLFTNSAENGAYALRAYDIQYWDGTAYQTVASVEGNKDPKLTSTFPSITTTRIRVLCKDPDSASKWYRISELEVYYDAPIPVEIAPHWLELAWDSAQTVTRIELFTNSAGDGAYALRGYDIQYWIDSDWQTLASVSANTDAQITSTFPAVSTTRIRIYCKEPDIASKWYRINEVEVYNDAQTTIENKTPETVQDVLRIYWDASSFETVVVAQEEIHQIQVYSMKGILVYQNLKSAGTHNYRISSGALAPGAYVVRVNRNKSKKCVIW